MALLACARVCAACAQVDWDDEQAVKKIRGDPNCQPLSTVGAEAQS